MYSREDAKLRAKKLRTILHQLGHEVTHATSLEVIAQLNHFKDWNTCSATLDKRGEVLPIPHGWQSSGDRREHYDIGIDHSIMYSGTHPAVIRYKSTAPKEGTGFATFMQSFDAVGYRSKRLQFSSRLKSEDCDGAVTIWVRADSSNKSAIAFDNLEGQGVGETNGPISGSNDWTQRAVVIDIPAEAEKISIGFYVRGRGTGYAAGFTLNQVSTDIPVTSGPTNSSSEPVNMQLKPDSQERLIN